MIRTDFAGATSRCVHASAIARSLTCEFDNNVQIFKWLLVSSELLSVASFSFSPITTSVIPVAVAESVVPMGLEFKEPGTGVVHCFDADTAASNTGSFPFFLLFSISSRRVEVSESTSKLVPLV